MEAALPLCLCVCVVNIIRLLRAADSQSDPLLKIHGSHIGDKRLVECHYFLMFWVLLITAQCTNGSKAHDQYQVPAAGVVQNVASDFQMVDACNTGSQSQHSSTELFDMCIADALVVSNQNVVLQH